MKARFIFNPHSGSNRRNPHLRDRAAEFIRQHGWDASVVATGSWRPLARWSASSTIRRAVIDSGRVSSKRYSTTAGVVGMISSATLPVRSCRAALESEALAYRSADAADRVHRTPSPACSCRLKFRQV